MDGDINDRDRIYGCCFPGECCMPGPHYRDECHTAEMIEDFEALRSPAPDAGALALEACRLFLKACRCVDIHRHGFGRAFDAAQKAVKAATQ